MRRVLLLAIAAALIAGVVFRDHMSVAAQDTRPPYDGETLIGAVRDGGFDPVLLPGDDSVQQRWIYAAMIEAFRRGTPDATTLELVKRWDGCTMWPAQYLCPYQDAIHRSGQIREALVARMAAAMPPPLAGRHPRVCYCNACISAAARTGDRDVLSPLLPDASEMQLRWALCVAGRENDAAAVRLLINVAKVDPSAKTEDGDTSLHYAAARGAMDSARALIDAGADVNAYQALRVVQQTPLDKAIAARHEELADLLKAAGGKTMEQIRILRASSEH